MAKEEIHILKSLDIFRVEIHVGVCPENLSFFEIEAKIEAMSQK